MLRADLVENLTKANPFGLPSGLFIIFTFKILPHELKRSLMSPSKALKERPCTATSNYPSSSSSFSASGYYFFVCFPLAAFLVISPEAFLFGAGFYSYYSSDSSFFKGFLAAGFFLAGSGYSDSSSESTAGFKFLGATLVTYFEPFLVGFGFYSDYYSSESAFFKVFAGALATTYFDAFLGFDFSEDYSSDFSTFLFLA